MCVYAHRYELQIYVIFNYSPSLLSSIPPSLPLSLPPPLPSSFSFLPFSFPLPASPSSTPQQMSSSSSLPWTVDRVTVT